jgi:hypothetical protein
MNKILIIISAFLLAVNAQYSDPTARLMVQYASTAYCPQSAVSIWNLNPICSDIQTGFTVTNTFYAAATDAFGYVGRNDAQKIIVVAFKGTNPSDIIDWIDDLESLESYNTPCNLGHGITFNGSVGFCGYYTSLQALGLANAVLAQVSQYPSYTLYVTGHSLGGAAAAIHIADLLSAWSGGNKNLRLYTFGEPRVGDMTFPNLISAYSFANQIFRVVHENDIVPHLPPCCLTISNNCPTTAGCPYQHPVEEWYDNSMVPGSTWKACSTTNGEDPTCSDSQIDVSIPDHLVYFGLDVGSGCCPST